MEPRDPTIERLTRELTPVRPAPSPWRPATIWLLVSAFAASALAAAVLSLRPDLAELLGRAYFVIRGAALLVAAWLAALAVQNLALPGRSSPAREKWRALSLPALLLAAFSLAVINALIGAPATVRCGLSESACTAAVLGLALIPASILFVQSRRKATTTPAWSGALIGVAASLLGASALGMHCPNDTPLHQLLWHLCLPLAIAAPAGAWAGRRWLRW
jgi:hypothetical protein